MSARGDIEDVLNQQLIAHLIEKEQALVAAAEEILLNYALIDSQKSSKTFHHNETNLELPVRSISEDATHVSDESFAQFLQTRSHATMNADQQLARRLAAEEKTMLLDQEFARRLQDIDSDQEDMDEEGLASVEDVLHQEEIDWILVGIYTKILGDKLTIVDRRMPLHKTPISRERESLSPQTLFQNLVNTFIVC